MSFASLTIGHIEVLALLDGEIDLDGSIADSFPDVPEADLDAFREAAPGVVTPAGGWRLHVRCWLVRHPGGVVLVDTGLGQAEAPAYAWTSTAGRLLDALREAGTPPEAVDTVVLSHVHDDHIGGCVVFDGGVAVPAFPRATYLLQRADRRWQTELAAQSEEDRLIDTVLLEPLERSGRLSLVDGDHAVAEGIELRAAPGHTPGHQVVRLRSRGSRGLITADAFNHPMQIPRPDLPAGQDDVPARAAATRRAILAGLLSNPGTVVAPTHFAEPFGEVRSGSDGMASWRPGAV